jgi:signal peptidase II
LLPGADEAATIGGGTGTSEPAAADTGHRGRLRLFWWVSAATVVFDQITKALVDAFLAVYENRTIIPGLVDLVHVQNAGVAFGLLNSLEHPKRALFTTTLALLALVGIAYYARQIRLEERLARLGLSLILGGAIGNLVDRVRQGYVIDFVDVYWGGWHFWAFNVADAAITVGATLVFIEVIFLNRHAPNPVPHR